MITIQVCFSYVSVQNQRIVYKMNTIIFIFGRKHALVGLYDVTVSRLMSDILPPTSHRRPFSIRDVHNFPTIPFVLNSVLKAWWAQLACHLELREHLIALPIFIFIFFVGEGHVCLSEHPDLPLFY